MPPKKGKTRSSTIDNRIEFLGSPCELMDDELPTIRGCIRFGILIMENALANEEEKCVKTIAREVYENVTSLYMKANYG